ncbi:MAG: 30S ribosomal protein S4 [bacterium]|nr:30S ribosomal protein S4 [bacterium]
MARNINSCKQCRRAGEKLFLKGERCLGPKCAFTRRSFAPGMHGNARQRRLSDYGVQLRAKQKAKLIYGLLEKQFRRYIGLAQKADNTGFALLRLLETRLDNIVYRTGMASSHAEARQLVTHGHVKVNGVKSSIPSYQCRAGDKIELEKGHEVKEKPTSEMPGWLTSDGKTATVGELSSRDQIDTNLNEQLIIEFYTR